VDALTAIAVIVDREKRGLKNLSMELLF